MRTLLRNSLSVLASTAMALTAMAGIQLATAQSASALAPCIDAGNANAWYLNASASTANTKSPTYTTTANCQDVNFALSVTDGSGHAVGRVRVCFVAAGYCQSSWKAFNSRTNSGPIVVASNVADGTTFKMEFDWQSGTVADRFGFGIWA